MNKVDWADKIGGILVGGFGPEVVNGLISKYLERIDLNQCQAYILNDHNLLGDVTDTQWEKLRKIAKASKLEISYSEVIKQVNKNRPDILAVLSCTDGGVPWLQRQVAEAKKHLAS